MLAEATRWLAWQGWELTLVARRPEPLAGALGARPVPFDWDAPSALDPIGAGFDLGLFWLHDPVVWLARPLEDLLRPAGRSVRVHGAMSADPQIRAQRDPDPRPGLARQTVILGWHPLPGGAKEWLSHREICTGTCFALAHPDRPLVQIGAGAGP